MNTNHIATNGFSNPDAERRYRQQWPREPAVRKRYENGEQCGGCSFFAKLDADWGICCHPQSRHRLETVFEHFTCADYAGEGWGPHSFSNFTRGQCGGVEISETRKQRHKKAE